MLSWSFAAAALGLILLVPLLGSRPRAVWFALWSSIAVWSLWHVPVWWILLAAALVHGVGRGLARLPSGTRPVPLAVAIGALIATVLVVRTPGASVTPGTAVGVVGISYLALKLIQHLVDTAAGRTADTDLLAFVCNVVFLPTYLSGPIERTGDFARELARTEPWTERALGATRIVEGIGKKLLLADPLLGFAQPMLAAPASASRGELLLAIYAFALGLYFDFAAYSDLAIGVARCSGVRVRENFDHPFAQRNLGQLWQHWHMSLTGWLRDYVFMPVTRRMLRRTKRPLASQVTGQLVTMTVCGLWHGLAWHYLLWGLVNGAGLGALAIFRAWRGPAPAHAPARDALARLATFHFFAAALVLFACDLRQSGAIAARLLGLAG